MRQVERGIWEVAFKTRGDAEAYFSTMADCIADVSFKGVSRDFYVTYAGGVIGACALHRATVSALTWQATESDEIHIVLPLKGGLTIEGPAGTLQGGARAAGLILPPSTRGLVDVGPKLSAISLIAPSSDVLRQAERLLAREVPERALPILPSALTHSDPVFTALARNMSGITHEMLTLSQAGLSRIAAEQFDDVLLSLLACVAVREVRDSLKAKAAHAGNGVVRAAQEYIRERASDPVRISAVAEQLGVGLRALQLAFRKLVGMSPRDYLMTCRLELARSRLLEGDPNAKVGMVAFECGFTDLALFSRKYRATFGELPSDTLKRR